MAGRLKLDLVRHMKARNREKWRGDDFERPLSKLGRRQAAWHAKAMLAGEPAVAVYASPALRCRETAAPVAELLGLDVQIEPMLADTRRYAGWFGEENPFIALLRERHPEGGRVIACSHGDTIPAFIGSLPGAMPGHVEQELSGFGGWFRVVVDGGHIEVERFGVPEGFPRE